MNFLSGGQAGQGHGYSSVSGQEGSGAVIWGHGCMSEEKNWKQFAKVEGGG